MNWGKRLDFYRIFELGFLGFLGFCKIDLEDYQDCSNTLRFFCKTVLFFDVEILKILIQLIDNQCNMCHIPKNVAHVFLPNLSHFNS
jgi:hypothetical protein